MRSLSAIADIAALGLCAVMLVAILSPARAQSDSFLYDSQDEQKNIVPERDPTRQELDEMQAVYDRCTRRFHSQYLDCRCVAVKFLDQRMREGQEPPRRLLLNRVYDQCPATAAVAGKTYNRCLNWASMMRRDFKRFCECYANHYARNFSDTPTLRPHLQQGMMSKAMEKCGYTEPLNRRARQRAPTGSQNRQTSELDTVFGGDD